MLKKLNQCIYTPKSKIHLHLGWQSLFIQALGCSDHFNVLIRIIQSTDNTDSVYTDVKDVDHPGMLINYDYLSQSLCLSRRTIQRILNQLEADGYINRIKLGRGKVLAQTTQKTCDLRDKIHANSSAYKANDADYQKFSKNFEVVYNQQKDIANPPKEINEKNNLGQIDRDQTSSFIKLGQFVTPQQKTNPKLGQIGTTPLNEYKVNTEKTIIEYSQYQVLETETQFENSDCLTVIFYFDDFRLPEIAAESALFDYFTVAQSQAINTIVHCYSKALDITAFNNILSRQDVRAEAKSFRQLVDWAYSAAFDAKEGGEVTAQKSQPENKNILVTLNEENYSANNNAVNLVNEFDKCGATSHPEISESLQNNPTQIIGDSVIVSTTKNHHDKINHSKQATKTNSNTVSLMDAFAACETALRGVITKGSATHQDGGSAIISTAEKDNDKTKLSNQADHKNNIKILKSENLKMPVVEREVLRKDWASLADQAFYNDVLPDCQKIALVVIIDYVKRKGVAIGSDQEIYGWLYHTVSNHQHYYSRAANFKHLANILMKQLINKKFEKPNGFDNWRKNPPDNVTLKRGIPCKKN